MHSNKLTHLTKGLDIYITPSSGKHTETLIFLHGLGDTAKGWFSFFSDINTTPCLPTTKVVLLTAPSTPVTANRGAKMPSWYDIKTFGAHPDQFEDAIGVDSIRENAKRIKAVIDEEVEALGGDSKRVIIGGFSQGCGMSLHTGLEYEKPLGGIIGYSGYLFPITKINEANERTPIFLSHGLSDQMVTISVADASLKSLDMERHQVVRLKEKELGHSVNDNILKETAKFIRKIFQRNDEL